LTKLVEVHNVAPRQRICNKTYASVNSGSHNAQCDNIQPAGFYAPVYYDSSAAQFKVIGLQGIDYNMTTKFHLFTTTGRLHRVQSGVSSFTFTKFDNFLVTTQGFQTLDCETAHIASPSTTDCLSKGDKIMFFTHGSVANYFKYILLVTTLY